VLIFRLFRAFTQSAVNAGGRLLWWTFVVSGIRGKTLWDLLSLMIIPLVIGLGVVWFNAQQRDAERQTEEERAKAEQDIEKDRAREVALQTHLDRIDRLLLEEGLGQPGDGGPARAVAKASTLAVFRQLDGERKGLLLRFLYDAGLIGAWPTLAPTIDVRDETQRGYDYSQETISFLRGETRHSRIEPILALAGDDLRLINLMNSELPRAALTEADLTGADLRWADLSGASLLDADLSGRISARVRSIPSDQNRTDLRGASLNNAVLTGANLSGTHLAGANLCGASVTEAQIESANSVDGSVLPKLSEGDRPCQASSLRWTLMRYSQAAQECIPKCR
jgi:hypothetical protein